MNSIRRTTTATFGGGRLRVLALLAAVAAVLIALALTIPPGNRTDAARSSGGSGSTRGSIPQQPQASTTASELASARDAGDESAAPAPSGDLAVASAGKQAATPERDSMTSSGGAAGTSSAAGTTTSSTGSLPGLDVKVLRTAEVTVRIKRGSFDTQWAAAMRLADRRGGYVSDSNLSTTGTHDPRSGTITLRVPAERFDDTLADLRGLGTVTSLDQSSQDVSQDYVDTKSRLRHDRAVETQLLGLLAKASTIDQTLTISDRLDSVQQQIEVESGRVQYLDKMTSYSTLQLRLDERGAKAATTEPSHHESWGLHDAVSDAAHRATTNVASAIVWLGGALPTLAVLALLLVAGRVLLVRRRRARTAGAVVAGTPVVDAGPARDAD